MRGTVDMLAAGRPPLHAWSHLAATYDGSALRLYLDGSLVGERAVGGLIVPGRGALTIGGNALWGHGFKGLIDSVRIFARALTGQQLEQLSSVRA